MSLSYPSLYYRYFLADARTFPSKRGPLIGVLGV